MAGRSGISPGIPRRHRQNYLWVIRGISAGGNNYSGEGDPVKNIVLIGMPGAGKSTAGVILAKTLGMNFTDTDIAIQEQEGRLLQEIIDTEGPDSFLKIEEKALLSLHGRNAVIATGGSVVFSRRAMEQLKRDGVVVYLKVSFAEMEKRLQNITTRGIVLHAGQSLRDMYNERVPLYEKYADITIDCSEVDFETVVEKVIRELKNRKVIRH
jgi:shikimate kinase